MIIFPQIRRAKITKNEGKKIIEIKNTDSEEFKQFLNIYLTSFPAVETKPAEKIKSLLKSKNYHLYAAVEDNFVIGFSLLYVFNQLGIGLLDYMAVVPKKQSMGIGRMLFKHSLEQLKSIIKEPIGMLLEIQNDSTKDSNDYVNRKKRLKFYAKLDIKVLQDVKYLIPPQVGNEPEETFLMIAPLKKINDISNDLIVKCISAIHQNVYLYMKTDLVDKIKKTLPRKIYLSNIKITN